MWGHLLVVFPRKVLELGKWWVRDVSQKFKFSKGRKRELDETEIGLEGNIGKRRAEGV